MGAAEQSKLPEKMSELRCVRTKPLGWTGGCSGSPSCIRRCDGQGGRRVEGVGTAGGAALPLPALSVVQISLVALQSGMFLSSCCPLALSLRLQNSFPPFPPPTLPPPLCSQVQIKHNKHKSEAIRKLLSQPPPGETAGLLGDDMFDGASEPDVGGEDSSVMAGDIGRMFRPRSRGGGAY